MHSLSRDFLFGLRALGRSPLFTLVAVLSLALGIGANTAIFTLTDQVLLRSLPVEAPERLVMISTAGSHVGSNRGMNVISYPMYKDYREKNEVFSGVLCSRTTSVAMSAGGPAEITTAEMVSGNYFQVLGIRSAAGRVFTPADETNPGANPVVVLAYEYWQSRFRGDPGVVGQTIRINSFPMTVVGVAAPGYHGLMLGDRPKLFVPVTMKRYMTPSWDDLENRRSRWVRVFARLKPGVDIRQAEAAIRPLYKQIINEEAKDPWFNRVIPFHREEFLRSYAVVTPGGQGFSFMRRMMEMPLKVLMGLVGIVLLIACANVSNLMVARAAGRRKEIAVRLAVGAGRWRIVRQLLVESTLVALAGGALGLLVSYWSMRGILLLAPGDEARAAFSAVPDGRALLFTLGVALAAAVLFGLFPALQASRADLAATMKDQGSAIAGGHGSRTRKVLVAAQVTLSLILLVGGALFVQSLRNLRLVDPGFRATNLIRMTVDPQLSGYDDERTRAFYQQVRQRLGALPGVTSAALARVGVVSNNDWDSTITVEGYQAGDGENMNPNFNSVSPGYLKTMGMVLKAGREFDDRDRIEAPRAVMVNETFANRYFPGRSPLGRRLGFGHGPGVELNLTIVGVMADAHYRDLREEIPRQVFVCSEQDKRQTGMHVYVRTSLDSERMFETIRREMAGLDPNVPIRDMVTMEDQLDRSLTLERMVAFLSSAYALLAGLLAVIGLYGVTAYGVARRAREIGIRMALGAQAGTVVRMVLREVATLAAAGIAVALPLAWWLTGFVRSQLYGIEPRDPATIGAAALGLLAVAAAAGAVPAVKASRRNPLDVLRYE